MCGIVLVGSSTFGFRDNDIFEKLLFCDTFRGDHSTGVFAGYQPVIGEHFIKYEKAAISGDEFLKSDYWNRVREHRVPSATVKTAHTITSPKFMVGHNRYATQGAVNNRNAHPFQHGHITLVHNGTLDDQSLLPEHKRFVVDSENICYSIATIGIAETIQKLHGKFTLVWHDSQAKTLNIIRNSERPFHLAETSSGDWFGASEEGMLMWILTRKKTGNPYLKRHFECEVGVQYVFDVSSGFKFKEEVKHELPTFRSTYTGNYSGWNNYDDDYVYDYRSGNNGQGFVSRTYPRTYAEINTPPFDKNAELNEMLDSHGIRLRIGESMIFEGYQFDKYPANPMRGKLTGFTGNTSEYIEIQAHGFDAVDFRESGDGEYKGKISSCYETNAMLTIIVTAAQPYFASANTVNISDMVERLTELNTDIPMCEQGEEDDDDIPPSIVEQLNRQNQERGTSLTQEELDEEYARQEEEDDEEQVEITKTGEVFTKKEWEGNASLNCCAACGSPILFDDVPDAVINNDVAYCDDCEKSGAIEGYPKAGGSEHHALRFTCMLCDQSYPEDAESVKEGVCIQCYNHYYPITEKEDREILVYRKPLKNGMKVTKVQWEAMNTCSWCNDSIHWKFAGVTPFIAQKPCCSDCEQALDSGIIPQKKTMEGK